MVVILTWELGGLAVPVEFCRSGRLGELPQLPGLGSGLKAAPEPWGSAGKLAGEPSRLGLPRS